MRNFLGQVGEFSPLVLAVWAERTEVQPRRDRKFENLVVESRESSVGELATSFACQGREIEKPSESLEVCVTHPAQGRGVSANKTPVLVRDARHRAHIREKRFLRSSYYAHSIFLK